MSPIKSLNAMNLFIILKKSLSILTILIAFQNCSKDDDTKPVVVPPVVVVPDPEIPAIAPTVCDFELDEVDLTDAGWKKVFEEDFSTDLSKWNVWTGGAYNNELQHYQASNMELADGKLIITAKKETVTGNVNPYDPTQKTFNYTSGRIESKTNFAAKAATPKVRIMARIKLTSGYGMWPAFWSYGDPWPTNGEIDIIEARGQDVKKYHTNYFYGTTAGTNLVTNASNAITADEDLTTCYHVYEMIWEKNRLTSILDGTVVEIKTSGGYVPSLFGKEEKIVLNLAVGGLFFSDLNPELIETGTLTVDWVKVFTH